VYLYSTFIVVPHIQDAQVPANDTVPAVYRTRQTPDRRAYIAQRHRPSLCMHRVVKIGVTCQVYLSARNGAWCAPRVWDGGLPLDLALFTRFTNSVSRLLPSRFSSQFQKAVNARFDHALYGLQPNHDITASSVIINDDLPSCIISGSVQVRPGIARLTSSGVQFTDGTHVDDIAAVICATGRSYGSIIRLFTGLCILPL